MAEHDLLAWLRDQHPTLEELLGDDAALLEPPHGPLLATVDSQIEGVHVPPGLDPGLLARRLLAVNLSDLAAMGALPTFGLLTLATPRGFDHRRFFRAFLEAAVSQDVQLAGGDLASAASFHATLTLLGSLPPGGRLLRRSGARPGDRLWVGGTLGESAVGRWLLEAGAKPSYASRPALDRKSHGDLAVDFPPRLRERLGDHLLEPARRALQRHLLDLGRRLGSLAQGTPCAGLDLSDGLAADLPRLCRASGVDARVELEALPREPDFERLCRALDRDPFALLTGGGEDYVLLFSLPPGQAPPREASKPDPGYVEIGEITEAAAEPGRALLIDQQVIPWPSPGWDHLER